MRDYIVQIRPKIVLFLIGINDIETEDFRPSEENIKNGLYATKRDLSRIEKILESTANYSEISSVLLNFHRYGKAKERGLTHKNIINSSTDYMKDRLESREEDIADFNKRGAEYEETSEENKRQAFLRHKKYLNKYEKQLEELYRILKENGIEPVFITQTSAPYERMEGLPLYNDITRKVAENKRILLIDLAKELPDNPDYYYDSMHYNERGAEKVSEVIYRILYPHIKKKYYSYTLSGI